MREGVGVSRNGVQPDERLYATLMGVAGAAGDLELAFSLQDEMVMDGLRPSKVRPPVLPCAAGGDLPAYRTSQSPTGWKSLASNLAITDGAISGSIHPADAHACCCGAASTCRQTLGCCCMHHG